MAAQTLSAAELSNAQRVYLTKIYQSYQNETDVWSWIDEMPRDKVNYKGLQVPFEVSPNPSLAAGTGNGDVFATAQASNYDNFVVTYTNLNAGTNETYAALLNNNMETSEDVFLYQTKSDARQFASFLNDYVSRGDGTLALATLSANYVGGTPTLAPCNGTTDSIGPSQLIIGGYYKFYDATGATQRTGTVGAGAIQLASKTAANAVFATNIPSDVVTGDIIVPENSTTDASYGLYGLPIIIDSSGTYFGKSRTTYNGLASFEKAASGAFTAGMLAETYASIVQRGGYFTGTGASDLDKSLWMLMNTGNWNAYYALSLSSGAVVGSPHTFRHTASERPGMDLGMDSVNFTWFGAPIKLGNALRGDEIYFLNPKKLRRAILKDVGDIASPMPAANYLQAINSSGNYLQAMLKYRDFFGQVYAPTPFEMGKISGITLTNPVQKATMVLSA